jgi:dephospho-CoA kinase
MADIKLIGLSGAIGAGKSTVAKHLCDSYGFTELTFKNSMVHCLAHIFEVDGQIFHDRKLKEKPDAALFGRSPREVGNTVLWYRFGQEVNSS